MSPKLRSLNFYLLVAMDLLLILAAHAIAYLIRFEGQIPSAHLRELFALLPWLVAVKLLCFLFFGLYQGMWRYTSLPDLLNVIKASTTASLLVVTWLLFTRHFVGLSRSVFLLDWLLTMMFIGGVRVGIRVAHGAPLVGVPRLLRGGLGAPRKGLQRYVLLGAGDAAERFLREIQTSPHSRLEIVAAFDDAPDKQGRNIRGVPVLAGLDSLPRWAANLREPLTGALIAIPSLRGEGLRRAVRLCEQAGLDSKSLPSLEEIVSGKVSIKELRDINYRDLLGREPARLETERIADCIRGKTVLVTGAGGSIGSELCRQLLPFEPGRLLLLDASESNLYAIQMELRHELSFDRHLPLLGTLCDRTWTEEVLVRHKPEVVFHAAAYKHVPMIEEQPWQAVWNNVEATRNLLALAVEHGVERFLVVSTDKAVRPTNVMGASKRLTELMMQAMVGRGMKLMAVRFGNVVGSAGSVVPLFRRQIEHGGPVTVTDARVVRYFMTIEEACQLIIQAASMGGDGEIFVLKMGQPVKIVDMARDLIRLSGREPDRDIAIRFIGLRPGEKLYEELITEGEDVVGTEHEQILVLKGRAGERPGLAEGLEALSRAAKTMDHASVRAALSALIPEYRAYEGRLECEG